MFISAFHVTTQSVPIYFRRVTKLHDLACPRYFSVKISHIELKNISKAERIKKLHFENKYQYGVRVNISKKTKVAIEAPEEKEEVKNEKDISSDKSSEIYWTCLHVPEVTDFNTSTKKIKKKKAKKVEPESQSSINLIEANQIKDNRNVKIPGDSKPVEIANKKSAKKIVIVPKLPQLPQSLTKLKDGLENTKIKDTLGANFKTKQALFELEDSRDEQDIPFKPEQLREILNFPMSFNTDKFINSFAEVVPEKSTHFIPSVSKVLQGTMPENQRKALIQWKNLKISELGLEGFEKMQQCEFHEII